MEQRVLTSRTGERCDVERPLKFTGILNANDRTVENEWAAIVYDGTMRKKLGLLGSIRLSSLQ